ncbi:MAG TPA: GntR family transcriptional regulator [Pseudolabrys sp.]|nr:GntR family transcriptional regulator [Pseudolabrys sp.]
MLKRTRARKVSALKATLRPLAGDSHRRASVDIHQYLRDLILSNALPPETILSQVEVADCLKVSRTPVREALRMLMEEGLVKAEPNYRCRVLGFDPRELEALYVSRIANEGIAAAVTVQNMTGSDIKKLAELLRKLRKDERPLNLRRWLKNHRTFHALLFCRANPLLQKRMLVDCQRSERYVYNTMQAGLTDLFRRAAIEHEEIYEACKRRQPAMVVALLTDHLAAAAIDIMAEFAPDWEPTTLRNAARLMHRGAAHLDNA